MKYSGIRPLAAALSPLALLSLAACNHSGTGVGSGSGTVGGGGSGTVTPTPPSSSKISLGMDADMGGFRPFPASSAWNLDVSGYALDPSSAIYVNSIGSSAMSHADFGTTWLGAPNGLQYYVVSGAQAKVPMTFTHASESDPGPYPVPLDTSLIEGGPSATGDRHVLVIDRDHLKLYELFNASINSAGNGWNADAGAVFDLANGTDRTAGWTSADAAGLPIYPGLVRYDEVITRGVINHALRFTAASTQNGYIYPARHAAGLANTSLPPMGLRMRLNAGYDISWASKPVQVILTALKKYGMILADNGAAWHIAGAPDPRWSDSDLHDLASVPGSAFEAVKTGSITTQVF